MWGNGVTSPTSTTGRTAMVRCFDCCNLIRSWRPATRRDWLFEEQWKCKVTGEAVGKYHFRQRERECKHHEKRPKLVLGAIG